MRRYTTAATKPEGEEESNVEKTSKTSKMEMEMPPRYRANALNRGVYRLLRSACPFFAETLGTFLFRFLFLTLA